MAIAMETDEEEEEQEMIELGNLSNYIVESIFSKIPLKSLVQLKTVSKTWRNSITNIRHCYPPTTSTGLVLFLKHKTYQESLFIKLHDHYTQKNIPKYCTLHSSCTHKYPFLIDSCNGVLLYASHNNVYWTYSVSSPVLDQFVSLPVSHHVTRPACSSLVFDGWHEFQVICFFWDEVDIDAQVMSCMIFSSDSWSWRDTQIRILNSELLLLDGFVKGQCFSPSVYSAQKVYWIWSLCLLVYDTDAEFFTLFPLPKNHSTKSRKGVNSQLLWESEGGAMHLCDPVNNGFFIWTFRENNFKLDHFVRLEEYINDQYLRLRMGYSTRPCAFNKDLQVLYFHVLPHTIVAYSFETRELVQVWSYCCHGDEEEEDCWIFKIHPFLF